MQPVGVVLDGDGRATIERPGVPLRFPALTGVELLPGDILRRESGRVQFAFCPSKQRQTLSGPQSLLLDPHTLPASASLSDAMPLEVCELPDLPPVWKAQQRTRRTPHPGDPSDPRVAQIDAALARYSASQPRLLLRIARAERLNEASLFEDSVAEYDAIAKQAPGAAWTRGLTQSILDEADRQALTRGARRLPNAEANPVTGKTYALLIGISKYKSSPAIRPLDYAAADAKTFADFLQSDRGGDLRLCPKLTPEEIDQRRTLPGCEIELITDEGATLANVSDAFERFINAHAGQGNRLIIFVAAHGIDPALDLPPDSQAAMKEPVILTYDSSYSDVKVTGYLMSEAGARAAKAALAYGSVLLFADVCRAGNVGPISWTGDMARDAVRQLRQSGIGLFMASAPNEDSYESPNFGGGHGAFTYAVLKSLTVTGWDAGRPLRYGDLKMEVMNMVGTLTNRAQTPEDYIPQPQMTLLNDLDRKTIDLGTATPLDKALTRRRPGAPPPSNAGKRGVMSQPPRPAPAGPAAPLPDQLSRALQQLDQLKQSRPAGDPDIEAYASQLRVALEDRGQQALIEYLKGDQIEPQKEMFDQCAADFQAALNLAGASSFDESRALFCQARALMFQKDQASFENAENLLQASIRLDSRRSYSYNALGIAWLEQAKKQAQSDRDYYALAESAFRAAIEYAPYWPYPWHNLALTSMEKGNYDAAVQQYEHAISLEPNYSYLHYNLGLLYQRINRKTDAEKSYRQARDVAMQARRDGLLTDSGDRKPEEAAAENALGTIAADEGHWKAAESFFRDATRDDPSNVAARHNLAVLLTRKPVRNSEAEDLWRGILSNDGKNLPARLALARYDLKTNQLPDSVANYRELLTQYPDLDAAHRELASALERQGDPAGAIAQFRLIRNGSHDDAVALERIGDRGQGSNAGLATEAWTRARNLFAAEQRRNDVTRLEDKLRSRGGRVLR